MNSSKKTDAALRVEQLRNDIRRHERLYYIENQPEISDYEFDRLMRRLQRLEEAHPELVTPDSPTHRVGGAPQAEFESHVHSHPMLSIDNCYSFEELAAFDNRVRRGILSDDFDYVCELKIDGLSLSLLYTDGILELGVTRGDGTRGDVVTGNVKTIRSLPLRIEPDETDLNKKRVPRSIEVRGEVYMSRKAFQEINAERDCLGEPPFANPRNSAAGTLRMLDSRIVARRRLDLFVYSLLVDEEVPFPTHWECLQWLRRHGFPVNKESALCKNLDEVMKLTGEWEARRDSLGYDVDGAVVKVNQIEFQRRLGTTAKFPRWATAIKFQPRRATTRLRNISVQVGRTGALTPVAELEPVALGGTVVGRATLHNEDEIHRLDARVGDLVLVEKGGDVIPKIVQVIVSKRKELLPEFRMPNVCPVCRATVFRPHDEVVSRCVNVECPARLKGNLLHFSSRRAMNIEGLGEALVVQLVESKTIQDVSGLYHLEVEFLTALERMGDKSASKLLDEIENSKKNDFSRLLFGLGIRFVGERTSQILAEEFPSAEILMQASQEDIEAVHEIGPRIAESVHFFFQQKKNRRLISRLQDCGVNTISLTAAKPALSGFRGKQFVLTGTLHSMTRMQGRDKIQSLGGRVTSSVSQKTDYVVVGENPGSKLKQAKNLNITLLSEPQFIAMLESEDSAREP